MPAIARVQPLTTARAVRGPFDYLLPAQLAHVGVGAMLVIPFAHREVLGVVVERTDRSELPLERLAAPLRALELDVPVDLVELALWLAPAYCSTVARALALVLPPGAGRGTRPRVRARTALVAELALAGETALLDPTARLTAGQRATLTALREGGARTASALPGGLAGVRRLRARGLVTLESREQRRVPAASSVGATGGPTAPPPTGEQQAAVAELEAALATGRSAGYLLHGVTGSGKTEVYIRAAEAALAAGRGVIVLVPEIALTPQLVGRFRARFGDTVALLHSKLGQGERHDEWLRLRRGEARICVGPRSAVFAPVEDLGLLVVDEEHEPAYKHEGDPRYDARTVARRRAELAGAVLLCGSATPRPESVRDLRRLRLHHRVDGRPLPAVEILDMRGCHHPLHPETHAALAAVRRERRKAIVLLNRRGWSNFLTCRGCGRVWGCPSCDVALVLHRDQGVLACHHCGHRERAPSRCGECGSVDVARFGAGTERIERELAETLGADADFPVVRLDADATARKGALEAALQRFDAAPAGVLVGTQMVAKGHDFPDIALAVVLDADGTLRFPDFRSEERTFSLIAQLAGRAGRGGEGRVLVQTLAPDEPSIVRAAAHDSDGFLEEELARREALGYPPFRDLIRVVCSAAPDASHRAVAAATAVRAALELPGADVLGPAPLFKLRGRERAQVVVKAADRAAAVAGVGAAVAAVAAGRVGRQVSFSVDVDPQ